MAAVNLVPPAVLEGDKSSAWIDNTETVVVVVVVC